MPFLHIRKFFVQFFCVSDEYCIDYPTNGTILYSYRIDFAGWMCEIR